MPASRTSLARFILAPAVSVLASLPPIKAQNLIPNGDFETGVVNCSVQGELPAPWFQATPQIQGADVYTCDDCVSPSLNGLSPGAFSNFPFACPPPSGERFIAGWSTANECPGVGLLSPVQDGGIYHACGKFRASETHGGTGPYELYLSADPSFEASDLLLTAVGAGAPANAWMSDSADFIAPAGSSLLPWLILVPTGTDTYVAIDDISLIAITPETYCTAGTSASGCQALLSASGAASATAPTGFTLSASTVEGQKDGLFFFGTNGQQANPWGNGTSYQCVVPPVVRTPTMAGVGTIGLCDGSFALDLNALWCPTCPKPAKNPGTGATVQAQLWYRDPLSTSNQTTSLSDAIEFVVGQ